MATRRRTVIISSTALDLPDHRVGLRDGCERAGFEPHMMEKLPALDADAIKASMDLVDEADVYVGVFAYRYGYVPHGQKVSITEIEYNRAVARDIPRLIFFMHEDHPITAKDVETGSAANKLKKFKERLSKDRVAAFFKSPGELRGEVLAALTTLGKKLDIEITGDAITSVVEKLHRKSSIPSPPTPYIAYPYTLLQLRDLVGRQAELSALTDWITKRGSQAFDARIFCVVAIGGMGKSALTWKWFNQIAPNEMKPLAGRMWWSFYESDATFENFLIRALCYVDGQSEEDVRRLAWQEREERLVQLLNEKPYLFVLDGLERILIAYNRMDAGRLADDDYDKRTANVVAGAVGLPRTAAQSFVGEHRLRQTTDPRAGALLQKLARGTRSRILITTRLYPTQLQLPTLYPRPGCFAVFLRGLNDNDALDLWRGLGVSGSRAELAPIFHSIENHPLLIQALASEIANYKRAPCDFARWRTDHPQFGPASLPLVQSRTHILEFALKGLSSKVREVLSMVVGFRMPASYAALDALLVGANKACSSAQELDRMLTELEDRGLIGWDREANRYDAHPIVRSVVWQLTAAKDQRAVFAALEAHFEPMSIPQAEDVEKLDDLTPAIERYHTLIGLGRPDDAFDLFFARLNEPTLFYLAAHRQRIEWLEQLFPHGVTNTPWLATESSQRLALDGLAQSYQLSGQPGQAVPIFQRLAESDQYEILQTSQANYGAALMDTGAFRKSAFALKQSINLSRTAQDDYVEAGALVHLGRLSSAIGDASLGCIAFCRAIKYFAKSGHSQGEALATAYLTKLFVRQEKLAEANIWAAQASTRKIEFRDALYSIVAEILQGRLSLYADDIRQADHHLHQALAHARAVNLVEFELETLVLLAELDFRRGQLAEARIRLDDVWEAAERGPYPLERSDAYSVKADIEQKTGNKSAAIEAATNAYKAAWCDGPPYAYHWGLQKAKAHLAVLGTPEPDMPPFDESKFAPLPEVEINPKDEYWVDPNKLD